MCHSVSNAYRSYHKKVEARRQLELKWNHKQEEKFKNDSDKKQEVALVKERKRLNLFEDLKERQIPFTNSDEVQQYIDNPLVDLKMKQK